MTIERRHPALPAVVASPDPRIAAWLLAAAFLGIVAVSSLPAARGVSASIGWMPLWLVGMPLASIGVLWTARVVSLRLPRRRMPDSSPAMRRRRPGTLQARRRGGLALRDRLSRAA